MNISLDQIKAEISDVGLKATHQRIVIYDYLMKSKTHPTVDRIYDDVKNHIPSVSVATIYRVLEDFVTAGLIYKVAEFNASATTVQVVASKKLAVLTPYVGLGFNAVSADLAMNGTYTLQNSTTDQLVLTDPVALEFSDGGGPRFTVGARLKLLVLTIHADYTAQKYSSFTMGLGLSIR